MHRIIVECGPVVLYSYGLSLVLGFLAATWVASWDARRHPSTALLTPPQIVDLFCLAMFAGLVGGRAFFVLLHWSFFRSHPWEIPALWHGGLIWYGGLFAGVLAGWGYARRHRIPFLRGGDFIAPYLALAHAIGRLGCFYNGCCYGRPVEGWLGVQFPQLPGPVLPTQLFESAGLFALFFLLRALRGPLADRPGRVLGAYLVLYAVLRFVIEFLRQQPVVWAGLTLQQAISLAVFVLGLALSVRPRRPGAP